MKETINKTDRQPTEWEKIFTNNISDEQLISKIHKKLIQFNNKKDKQPDQKLDRRPKQIFFKEDHIF